MVDLILVIVMVSRVSFVVSICWTSNGTRLVGSNLVWLMKSELSIRLVMIVMANMAILMVGIIKFRAAIN